MKLSTRILRLVAPLEQGGGGPMPKTVLRGIARKHGKLDEFPRVLRQLLGDGALVIHGSKRGSCYGLPRRRRA